MNLQDVVKAWNEASPVAIHPTRETSEGAYWASGELQAEQLAGVLGAGSRVVDFGCGDGRVAIPLYRRRKLRVVGVDSSPRMIDALREREPKIPTLVSDGSDLVEQLDGVKVDALYCLAVLIHHSRAEGEDLIATLVRAVRKGGLLILDWPTSDRPVERRTWIEVTTWPTAEQDRIAAQNGLERVESDLPWTVWRRT